MTSLIPTVTVTYCLFLKTCPHGFLHEMCVVLNEERNPGKTCIK